MSPNSGGGGGSRSTPRASRSRLRGSDCSQRRFRTTSSRIRARPGRRVRLQATAEQEGRGGRRDRPARHAEVDRERRAAGGRGARRPPRGRQRRSRASPGRSSSRRRSRRRSTSRVTATRTRASPDDAATSTGCSRRCAGTRSLQLGGNKTIDAPERPAAGQSLTLSAEAALEPDDAPVAIVFGPENGAVSEKLVFEAAREAHLSSYEQLLVIGFAIEPNARALVDKIEATGRHPGHLCPGDARPRDGRPAEDDAVEPDLLGLGPARCRDPQGRAGGEGRAAALRGRAARPRRLRPDDVRGEP